ncbi:MAG TPA: ribosome small subunit-dependent GTPase A [Candidatus Marinimicrobia bacterium]|nr:ribosome small subunit-dependent GTPase A [Candidatus Neomarinimicrobiota bacterium]
MSTILQNLGYDSQLDTFIQSHDLADFEIGRVIRESRQKYIIKTQLGNFNGQISGKLMHEAKSRADYPAVGDWVAIKQMEEREAIIHEILPRKTIIERQAIGRFGKKQTIAANVDTAFVLQDIAHDFNLNRLDRLIAIGFASKIKPVVILTKIDIEEKSELADKAAQIKKRFTNIPILFLSNKSMEGFSAIQQLIEYGKTYCFIGASGAGKSTLINNLVGEKVMLTKSLREKSNKGRHTTSHRELFILKDSGILIDTPGMRELGIAESYKTLEATFEIIFTLSESCKYSDCTHLIEPGCAVRLALENNEIDQSYYDNFHKMKEEQNQFELNKKGIKDKKMIKKIKADSKYKKSRR